MFLEDFLEEFEQRQLDIACPLYMPYRSTPAINAIHVFFNAVFVVLQKVLPEQDTASSSRGKPSREVGDSIPTSTSTT